MVRAGFVQPGELTRDLSPLSAENMTAIALWNRMDGAVVYPDVLYLMALERVRDFRGMLQRLDVLRKHFSNQAARQKH